MATENAQLAARPGGHLNMRAQYYSLVPQAQCGACVRDSQGVIFSIRPLESDTVPLAPSIRLSRSLSL